MTDIQLSILLDSLAKELETLIEDTDANLPDSVERLKLKHHASIRFPECVAMICLNQDHYTKSTGYALIMTPLMDFQERMQAYAIGLMKTEKGE